MPAAVRRRLFSVDEYYLMAQAGILHEDDRVELIEGEIIQMPPIGSPHAMAVDVIGQLLIRGLGADQAFVRTQNPLHLGQDTEPQPDVAVVKPPAAVYRRQHPAARDVLLLIEVSDSTLEYDRRIKLPLYAQANIPEVWIIDLNAGAVETYSAPQDGRYTSQSVAGRGDSVSPQAFPDLSLAVNDILGP